MRAARGNRELSAPILPTGVGLLDVRLANRIGLRDVLEAYIRSSHIVSYCERIIISFRRRVRPILAPSWASWEYVRAIFEHQERLLRPSGELW